ncbi:hypothetical protein H5410_028026 [Solanum commersonii]|uniref:Uncharacterized protein n=1 Tax=Solanum commersonii TaxID=4109 RepID=A0A9J5Z696_SOLCO|nr:hypothetical protein H5410_028026 [Solanum commersonii]
MNDAQFYDDAIYTFWELLNRDDYSLSIVGLLKVHRVGVGDEIRLFWHPILKKFMFKYLLNEEESYKLNNTTHVLTRELIEIRDIYPPPKIDLENPWHIKLNITHDEVVVPKLVIPFVETFEYILRYLMLDMGKSVENGYGMPVDVWDVTKENVPKKYEGGKLYPSLVSLMSDQRPLNRMKKTFFYNFFPSKVEEEACKVNNTQHVVTRELMETNDLYPAPKIDLQNPWQINKKSTHDEIIVGKLMIPIF